MHGNVNCVIVMVCTIQIEMKMIQALTVHIIAALVLTSGKLIKCVAS